MATDSAGNVYVSDWGSNTIRRISPAGVVTTLAGSAAVLAGGADGTGGAARFHSPAGVAIDSGGNVYVADADNHAIRKITAARSVTTLAGAASFIGSADGTAGTARFNSLSGVSNDSRGGIYVADTYNHTIRKINPAGVVTTLAGSPGADGRADGTGIVARLNSPFGVAADSKGNIYVADTFNHTIRKVTPAGVVTTLAGAPGLRGSADGTAGAARFDGPRGVAADSAGNVYVTDWGNSTIRKITAAGAVTTFAGSAQLSGSADGSGSAARLRNPTGVATDSAGNVYVADEGNGTIRRITPARVVTTVAGSSGLRSTDDGTGSAARFGSPFGVATDSGGNLYVADRGSNTIRKVTPAGTVTTVGGSATNPSASADGTGNVARFNGPMGVATDARGNVYVADTFNHRIAVGRPAPPDAATIDFPTGRVGTARRLSTSSQTATSWQWRIIRQPSASAATLSSSSIRSPVFTPDVADFYTFQLTATDGVNTSITTVTLTATSTLVAPTRRRAIGHTP